MNPEDPNLINQPQPIQDVPVVSPQVAPVQPAPVTPLQPNVVPPVQTGVPSSLGPNKPKGAMIAIFVVAGVLLAIAIGVGAFFIYSTISKSESEVQSKEEQAQAEEEVNSAETEPQLANEQAAVAKLSTPCYSFEAPEEWAKDYIEDETCSLTTKDYLMTISQFHTGTQDQNNWGIPKRDMTSLDAFVKSEYANVANKPKEVAIKLDGVDAIRTDEKLGTSEYPYTNTKIFIYTLGKGYVSSSGSEFNGLMLFIQNTQEPQNGQVVKTMIDTWKWK